MTVLRSGVPDIVPGRSLDLGERGIAAMLAGELTAGEVVGVEMHLALAGNPLRVRAMVRHQDKLRCGMEFLGLTAEQRGAIREWAKQAEPGIVIGPATATAPASMTGNAPSKQDIAKHGVGASETTPGEAGTSGDGSGKRTKKRRGARIALFVILFLVVTMAAAWFSWNWNRGWAELESGLKTQETAGAEKPQAQVPAEVMEKLLVHRVEPAYPEEARKENLQGVIALDIVIGRDGSVVSMHPLNGPEVLARAAMDALRWWKFEPYRVNGAPAAVETTVAVEFKK